MERILLSLLFIRSLSIDPIDQAIVCEKINVVWSGGDPPYQLELYASSDSGHQDETYRGLDGPQLRWKVDFPPGSSVLATLQDWEGTTTETSFVVLDGSDLSCLNDPQGGQGFPGTGHATASPPTLSSSTSQTQSSTTSTSPLVPPITSVGGTSSPSSDTPTISLPAQTSSSPVSTGPHIASSFSTPQLTSSMDTHTTLSGSPPSSLLSTSGPSPPDAAGPGPSSRETVSISSPAPGGSSVKLITPIVVGGVVGILLLLCSAIVYHRALSRRPSRPRPGCNIGTWLRSSYVRLGDISLTTQNLNRPAEDVH